MQSAADAKAAYAKQQWEETVASRTQMEQSRRAAAGAAREEGERLALLARRNAEESLARDAREVVGQRERTIAVKQQQLRDAAERRKASVESALMDKERSKVLASIEAEEDDKFRRVCEEKITEYSAEGKPIVTLLKAMRFKQPELIPALLSKKDY